MAAELTLSGGPIELGGVERLAAARACGNCSNAEPKRAGARLEPARCDGGDMRSVLDSSCGSTGAMASGLENDGVVRNGRGGAARGELWLLVDPSLARSKEVRHGCELDTGRWPR